MITQNSKLVFKKNLRNNIFAFFLMLPTILIFSVVILFPIAKGIVVSFCNYTLATLTKYQWNNFNNYIQIFKDFEILIYFKNTLLFVLITVGLQFIVGMCIALLLNSINKGKRLLRGLYLIPWTVPSVVVAILWKWMLQEQFGVMNYLLFKSNITNSINIAWLQNNVLALVGVSLASIWRQLPYMIIMLLAGLQSVDRSLIESATLEGASSFQVFRKVTVPSIKPVVTTAIWISILDNFQMFTVIYNMTGGGPVHATTTLSIAAYKRAFESYNLGEGSAIGMLWMIVLIFATIGYNKINQKYSDDLM
jgi:multiple sugar transport system permease protein